MRANQTALKKPNVLKNFRILHFIGFIDVFCTLTFLIHENEFFTHISKLDLVINYLLLIEDDLDIRFAYVILIENDLFKHIWCKKKLYFEQALGELYYYNKNVCRIIDQGDSKYSNQRIKKHYNLLKRFEHNLFKII